jgi:hypothetical protein
VLESIGRRIDLIDAIFQPPANAEVSAAKAAAQGTSPAKAATAGGLQAGKTTRPEAAAAAPEKPGRFVLASMPAPADRLGARASAPPGPAAADTSEVIDYAFAFPTVQ